MEAEQTTLRVPLRWPAGRRVRRALALFGLACLAWTAAALPLVWVDAVLWLLVTGTGWAAAILVAKRLADGQERRSMAGSGPFVRLTHSHIEVPLGAEVRRFDRRHLRVEAWATQPQNHRGVYTHQAWVRLAEGAAGGEAEGAVVLVGAREQGVFWGGVSLGGVSSGGVSSGIPETWTDETIWAWGRAGRAAALPAELKPRLGLLRDAWSQTLLHAATGVAHVRALLALGLAADARRAGAHPPDDLWAQSR